MLNTEIRKHQCLQRDRFKCLLKEFYYQYALFLGQDQGDIIKKNCLFKPVPVPSFILSPEDFFFHVLLFTKRLQYVTLKE